MSAPLPDNHERLATTSMGLWGLRNDLRQLFPNAEIVNPLLSNFANVSGYLGWGNKPSGLKALRSATRNSAQPILLEDGFLHGFFAGRIEPPASYIVDHSGVHYDSTRSSDLETLIAAGIKDRKLISRARAAMDELVAQRISKYNNSPLLQLADIGIDSSRPFILLVDQVPNDASIAGAQANSIVFKTMLDEAIRAWPDHQIVVRPHLASRQVGHLQAAASGNTAVIILRRQCNVWPLLQEAAHVYTVSSHCGFEALFCGTPVTCFGFPFYAGWGLTHDALSSSLVPNRGAKRSLEEVFAASYLLSSHYLDLHSREPTSLENSIDALSVISQSRSRNRSMVATVGMSTWKRRAVDPFLISSNGKPKHCSTIEQARQAVRENGDGIIAVWGETEIGSGHESDSIIRLEDGFLRSTGLGAALRFPLSLVRDATGHLYYDARGRGMIDALMSKRPFGAELMRRSSTLIQDIVRLRLSKYQLEGTEEAQGLEIDSQPSGKLKILVTGQVENDASIRLSTENVNTNTGLLQAVRLLFPDSLIAYREHPDVANDLRPGKADRTLADLNADAESLPFWLDWCDRLETMTSLTGFEALLRNKVVGVHGWPFYAGWGLTDDRLQRSPKGTANLEELFAATMLLYPDYVHPRSKLPCTPERIVAELADPPPVGFLYHSVLHPLGEIAGRIKHKLENVI